MLIQQEVRLWPGAVSFAEIIALQSWLRPHFLVFKMVGHLSAVVLSFEAGMFRGMKEFHSLNGAGGAK
jgi:hypothetical protein